MNTRNPALLGAALTLCYALSGGPAHAQAALSTDMDTVDKTLDLFFVAQNSNIYETHYPFLSTTQVTGIASRPPVAALGAVTSYLNTLYSAPEVFYITEDASGKLDVEELYGTTFSATNLSQKTGAASATPGTGLVGFIDTCANTDDVFYIGSNGHVELLTWAPGLPWTTQDLTQVSGTAAAAGTAIVGHIKGNAPNQSEEVFYLEADNHVHELWRWSGCTGGAAFDGWHNVDVSAANGDTGVIPRAQSALASLFDAKSGTDAVFYIGTDAHVHELFFSTTAIWSNIDLTHNTSGPALEPGTSLAAHINSLAGSEEVYYFDTGKDVRELWASSTSPTAWNGSGASINSSANGAPAAEIASPLFTDVNTLGAFDDVYYVGTNQHVYQLAWAPWRFIDVTLQATAPQVRGGPGGPATTVINFDTDTNGNPIASGTNIDSVYAPWGVTFTALTCPAVVPNCGTAGGLVYAESYPDANGGTSSPYGSAPNAVTTLASGDALMNAYTGVIRANFTNPQTQVSIMAFQLCDGQDFACLGPTPASAAAYISAYDSNNNLLCQTTANPNVLGSWQVLSVTSNCTYNPTAATIAYVEFAVGYPGLNQNELAAEFDNLSF